METEFCQECGCELNDDEEAYCTNCDEFGEKSELRRPHYPLARHPSKEHVS